jgi:hypothetical protein
LAQLRDVVQKVRSKNAGPFWLTVDIFCGTPTAFERVSAAVQVGDVATVFGVPAADVKRFDLPKLQVIKFSLPRPMTQGAAHDRDMHGASWAALIGEMAI